MDLYTTNNDYTGSRTLEHNKELVEYHANSNHRIWYNEQTEGFDAHWHTAMEIIIPIENYYDVIINNENIHIVPGDILLIAPGLVHQIIAPSYGKRYVFLMDISVLTKMNGFSSVSPIMSSPIILNKQSYPNIYDDVYNHLLQIRNIYFNSDEFSELKIHAHMTSLLIAVAEDHLRSNDLFPNTRIYKQREYAQKFGAILDYIETHYTEDIELDDIARISGFSKFHFSRLFKQYTDMTFCDYLNYRRIRASEELLSSPELSITELALQSGFPSISTFNRIFKQKHGITPSEYRAKNSHYALRPQAEKK